MDSTPIENQTVLLQLDELLTSTRQEPALGVSIVSSTRKAITGTGLGVPSNRSTTGSSGGWVCVSGYESRTRLQKQTQIGCCEAGDRFALKRQHDLVEWWAVESHRWTTNAAKI